MIEKPTIAVIGLGTMGLGIAQVYAQAGFPVLATDAHAPARVHAKAKLNDQLTARVNAGKISAQSRDATLSHLTIVDLPADMASASLVIEAIVEQLEAKQALFAEFEQIVAPDTVLATNTSSLSVAAIAKSLTHPARLIGLHFFNPAPVLKLVELIAHGGSDAAALTLARDVTEAAGKTVIACADRPGFIVNRCARPFYGEALAMLEEGRSASDIDAAMLAAGYSIGPFSLIDLIGADVHLAATQGVYEGMNGHPRYHVFDALKAQAASGNLGRKSGRGFIFPDKPGPVPTDAETIALRIEATLVNEAASLLDEDTVDADAIDTATKLGLGFPRGPFETARLHTPSVIRAALDQLAAKAPFHLKGRYIIARRLEMLG